MVCATYAFVKWVNSRYGNIDKFSKFINFRGTPPQCNRQEFINLLIDGGFAGDADFITDRLATKDSASAMIAKEALLNVDRTLVPERPAAPICKKTSDEYCTAQQRFVRMDSCQPLPQKLYAESTRKDWNSTVHDFSCRNEALSPCRREYFSIPERDQYDVATNGSGHDPRTSKYQWGSRHGSPSRGQMFKQADHFVTLEEQCGM